MSNTRQPVTDRGPQKLPFGTDFQMALVRHLCEDGGFAHIVADYLEPEHFETEVLAWAVAHGQRHRAQYGSWPGFNVLRNQVRHLDLKLRPMYEAVLEQVAQAPLRDLSWMKNQVIDFIKRSIFVRSFHESRQLYNSGKVIAAYDLMMERMERVHKTAWESVERSWYFEELPMRQNRRMQEDPWAISISTGLPWLDEILDGGLALGEAGCWVGYSKTGKSIMLNAMGIGSTRMRRNTLHCIFEGHLRMFENRYDAAFLEEWYRVVKHGNVDAEKYAQTWAYFQEMRGSLVIRAFTEDWDYSVVDVHNEIKTLERQYNWRPETVILDYGDLLRGRASHYANETEKQRAAFRDIKSLANRGYAVWTASQAQRPKEGAEDRPHWIYSRMIADCYDIIRVLDFIGSVNCTNLEKQNNVLRLLAELYRDDEAGRRIAVRCIYGQMIVRQEDGLVSPSMPDLEQQAALGYTQQQQKPAVPQQTGFQS
jgi:hypothetical protein